MASDYISRESALNTTFRMTLKMKFIPDVRRALKQYADYIANLPAADVVEAPQWQSVSDPPKTSGRYIVWCDQWSGWNMRMCNYLQSVKEWHDDCGHDVTEYVKKWTDKPKPPKEYET